MNYYAKSIYLVIAVVLIYISAMSVYEKKADCAGDCGDVVKNPEIRPTGGLKNKSRFLNTKRKQSSGNYRCHYGIDILAAKGTKLNNIYAGKVTKVVSKFKPGEYKSNSFGNYVVISTKNGKFIKYAHLDKVNVKVGDALKVGDIIGEAGNTGNASNLAKAEHHVHIEVASDQRFRDWSLSCKNDKNAKCVPEDDCCDCSPFRIDPEDFMKTKYDDNGEPK